MRYADILADIERAAAALPAGLGRDAVLARLEQPASLRAIAARLQRSYPNLTDAYAGAIVAMSAILEPDARAEQS